MAKFGMDEFEEAIELFERARKRSPELFWVELVAAYAHLGRKEEATDVLETLKARRLKRRPGSPLLIRRVTDWYSFKNPADEERLADGLRKVGLPE